MMTFDLLFFCAKKKMSDQLIDDAMDIDSACNYFTALDRRVHICLYTAAGKPKFTTLEGLMHNDLNALLIELRIALNCTGCIMSPGVIQLKGDKRDGLVWHLTRRMGYITDDIHISYKNQF